MSKKFQARQGDLLFEAVTKVPAKAKPKRDSVLAYGEVTGHAHVIENFEDVDTCYVDDEDNIFVGSKTAALAVGHEEHGVVTLPKDTIVKVTRQRIYDPLAAEKERQVAD